MKKLFKSIKGFYKDYAEFMGKHKVAACIFFIYAIIYGVYVTYLTNECSFTVVPKTIDEPHPMADDPRFNLNVE